MEGLAARGSDISVPEGRARPEEKRVRPTPQPRGLGGATSRRPKRMQARQRSAEEEPPHQGTRCTEGSGARQMQRRLGRQLDCALKRCRYCPGPRAGPMAQRRRHPWPAQTTPAPGGPVCGIDAGCAAAWGTLSSSGPCPGQRQVLQSLTHVKD